MCEIFLMEMRKGMCREAYIFYADDVQSDDTAALLSYKGHGMDRSLKMKHKTKMMAVTGGRRLHQSF